MRPKSSCHLNVGTAATSITDADAQKTPNHKMAMRQKAADPPAQNSSAPEAEQGGAE